MSKMMKKTLMPYNYTPVKLFFTVNTPEDGEDTKKCPIIFIHGFFSTNRTWNFVKYKIANKTKRKVYSLDLRNHGQSEYSEFFTSRHCMIDIENFMKSQNIPKAIFLAHSLGSRSVMDLALTKPEVVEKLIVEDMTVTDTMDHPTNIKRLRLFTATVDRFIRNAPADMSESDLHKNALPLIRQFYPEVNESSASKTITLPIKKDKSGKITWDMNVEAIFHYFDNLNMFQIDLSDSSKFHGQSLFLFGEKSPLKMEENKETTLKKLAYCWIGFSAADDLVLHSCASMSSDNSVRLGFLGIFQKSCVPTNFANKFSRTATAYE